MPNTQQPLPRPAGLGVKDYQVLRDAIDRLAKAEPGTQAAQVRRVLVNLCIFHEGLLAAARRLTWLIETDRRARELTTSPSYKQIKELLQRLASTGG